MGEDPDAEPEPETSDGEMIPAASTSVDDGPKEPDLEGKTDRATKLLLGLLREYDRTPGQAKADSIKAEIDRTVQRLEDPPTPSPGSVVVSCADLLEALKLSPTSKTDRKLEGHVRVCCEPAQIVVWASKDRLASKFPVRATATDSFQLVAPAARIQKALSANLKAKRGKYATLSRNGNGETMSLAVQMGTLDFACWVKSEHPSFDDVLANAKSVATVYASNLIEVLKYAKDFAGGDDQAHPEQNAIECRDGVIQAMSGVHAAKAKVPGLKGCNLRVHRKDVPDIVRFLRSCGKVELLEDDNHLVVRRHGGACLIVQRPESQPPRLGTPPDEDQHRWALNKQDILAGLPVLEAGADRWDGKLRLLCQHNGVVTMAMRTPSQEWISLRIGHRVAPENGEEQPPVEAFLVHKDSFRNALRAMPGGAPVVGINKSGKGGYVRFLREDGGAEHWTVVAWLKGLEGDDC